MHSPARQRPTIHLSLRAVTRLFGETIALRDVDLSVRSPGIVVVHGPNGSGKSTLLQLIAGLLQPTAGVLEWRSDRRPRIALLTHATHLVDALSARENLDLARRIARRPSADVDDLLALLGLAHHANRPVRSLSVGTRRRCGLARALITDPDVLVVDEPFAALDRAACGLVRDVLDRARTDGRLVVIATHDEAAGGLVADQVLDLSPRSAARPLAVLASR